MPGSGGSILDVLKGKESVKIEVGLNTLSVAILGITIMVAVAIGVFVAKKVS